MKMKTTSYFILAILLLATPHVATAQSPIANLSVGNGSGLPGAMNINVPVDLTSQDGAQVAGLNFDLSFDASRLEVSAVNIGSSAFSAGKSLSWSQLASNRILVIIFAVNQTVISDGSVAVVSFNVLVSAAPGSSALTLSNVAATDPDAKAVPVNSSNGSFTVLAPPTTNTPTGTSTRTPASTSTSTTTPTSTAAASSPTPTATPAGPSSTPSSTPMPTNTPTGGATNTPVPGNTPTKTLTTIDKPEETTSPTVTGSTPADPSTTTIPSSKGEVLIDLEEAVAATGTTMAEFEAAICATATSLADSNRVQVVPSELESGLWGWICTQTCTLYFVGLAIGAIILVTVLIFIFRRRRRVVSGQDLDEGEIPF
jgi:hypothetical protein